MGYIPDLTAATAALTKYVEVLQGARWDASQDEARRYLVSMDMDLAFATGLLEDMRSDNFTRTIQNITQGFQASTGHKSIAIWVRKFGFEATLTSSGDRWNITYPRNIEYTNQETCGGCAFWEDGLCQCCQSENFMTHRFESSWPCAGFSPAGSFMGHHFNQHMPVRFSKGGCIAVVAVIIAILAFIGIWMFTGSLWAAIYFFEFIFEFIMELSEMFY